MTGPVEPPQGQDDDAPDLDLALAVVIDLLADVHAELQRKQRRNVHDLMLRIGAVRRVFIRLQGVRNGGQ